LKETIASSVTDATNTIEVQQNIPSVIKESKSITAKTNFVRKLKQSPATNVIKEVKPSTAAKFMKEVAPSSSTE